MYKKLILLIFCLLLSQEIYAEKNFIVFSGIGFPELINVGTRYQFEEIHLGASFGFPVFLDDLHKRMNSVSFFPHYYFAGFSELTKAKTWYLKTGITYLWGETSTKTYENVFLDIKVGKEFNLSNRFGVGIGAGTAIQVYEKPPSDMNIFLEPFFPSIGIDIYYRL